MSSAFCPNRLGNKCPSYSTSALDNMNDFKKQNDTAFVAKDFAMKAALLEKIKR